MKKKYLIVCILFFIEGIIHSQTIINAGSVQGTWTKANSPYRVTGIIRIDTGKTLTIQPGVRVEFYDHTHVDVRGSVRAIGAVGDSIDFTLYNATANYSKWHDSTYGWRGFLFYKTPPTSDSSIFSHCKFSFTNKTDTSKINFDDNINYFGNTFYVFSFKKTMICNSVFRNCRTEGSLLYFTNSSQYLFNCLFENNYGKGVGSIFGRDCYIIGDTVNATIYNISITKNRNIEFSTRYPSSQPYGKDIIRNINIENNFGIFIGIGCQPNDTIKNFLIQNNSDSAQNFSHPPVLDFSIGNIKNIEYNNNKIYIPLNAYNFGIILNNQNVKSIDNLTIYNNILKGGGRTTSRALYWNYSGDLTLSNSKIFNQDIGIYILNKESKFSMYNCIIANCDSIALGSGAYQTKIINSAFVNNKGYGIGVGCLNCIDSALIVNSIVSGNGGNNLRSDQAIYFDLQNNKGQIQYDARVHFDIYNSNIQYGKDSFHFHKGYGTTKTLTYINNLDTTIQFVNPTAGAGRDYDASLADWHLRNDCNGTSPLVNRGITSHPNLGTRLIIPATDLDGNPRVQCGQIDIGPYETQYSHTIAKTSLLDSIRICTSDTFNNKYVKSACGTPNLAYQWQEQAFGSTTWSTIDGATNATLSISNVNSSKHKNKYRVVLTNTVCSQTDTTNPTLLLVKSLPKPDLGADKEVDSTAVVTLDAGSGYTTYMWDNNANTQTRLVNNANQVGIKKYWVEISDGNGCKGRDTIQIAFKNFISIGNIAQLNAKIYPNPANDKLYIALDNQTESAQITVIDVQGKTVLSHYANSTNAIHELTIQNIPKGVYTLQLKTSKGTYYSKLVID